MSQDTHLFQALILQLSQAAWAALGKVPNPITGKIERNLEAARLHIDTLAAIEKRTQGNLDETESKLMQRVLRDLQLNFVEESKKPDEPAATETPESPASEPNSEPSARESEPGAEDSASEEKPEKPGS